MKALSERQVQIAELVREEGFQTVEILARKYGLTAQTIRRDLNTLCDHNLVRRRHGGVDQLLETRNVAYGSRQILARHAKQAIAKEVARHVPNGASVTFSVGTTPELTAEALLHHDRLRVFTNNLNVAMLACSNSTFEVFIAGGRMRNSDRDILGIGMESFLSSFKVDIGIYGVAGVDERGTLLDFYEEEVRARELIRENSRATFLVLDHTKFDRAANVRGGHICDSAKVFCDFHPPEQIVEMIAGSQTELVICGGGQTK
jgi:DeoR family glycerol-3-phosphate regulon repressor